MSEQRGGITQVHGRARESNPGVLTSAASHRETHERSRGRIPRCTVVLLGPARGRRNVAAPTRTSRRRGHPVVAEREGGVGPLRGGPSLGLMRSVVADGHPAPHSSTRYPSDGSPVVAREDAASQLRPNPDGAPGGYGPTTARRYRAAGGVRVRPRHLTSGARRLTPWSPAHARAGGLSPAGTVASHSVRQPQQALLGELVERGRLVRLLCPTDGQSICWSLRSRRLSTTSSPTARLAERPPAAAVACRPL